MDGRGVVVTISSDRRDDADERRTVTCRRPSSATSASVSARPPSSDTTSASTCSDAMAAAVSGNWSAMSIRAARNSKRKSSSVYQMMHWSTMTCTMREPA